MLNRLSFEPNVYNSRLMLINWLVDLIKQNSLEWSSKKGPAYNMIEWLYLSYYLNMKKMEC